MVAAPPLLLDPPALAFAGERSLFMERRLAVDEGRDEDDEGDEEEEAEEWLRGGLAALVVVENARRRVVAGFATRRALAIGSRGGIVDGKWASWSAN